MLKMYNRFGEGCSNLIMLMTHVKVKESSKAIIITVRKGVKRNVNTAWSELTVLKFNIINRDHIARLKEKWGHQRCTELLLNVSYFLVSKSSRCYFGSCGYLGKLKRAWGHNFTNRYFTKPFKWCKGIRIVYMVYGFN